MNKTILLAFICGGFMSCSGDKAEYKVQDKFISGMEKLPFSVSTGFELMNSDNSVSNRLKIDLEDYYASGVTVSKITDRVKYIPLNSDKLIGEAEELFETEAGWVVVDSRLAKSVFMFDEHGEFLRPLGANGQGPGEYIAPSNVSVNEKGVFVHSEFQGMIFNYDFNGTLIKTYRVPFLFDDFLYQDGALIFNVFNRTNGHIKEIANSMLVVTDESLNVTNAGVQYDPDVYTHLTVGFKKMLKKHGAKVYYIQPLTTELYELNLENGALNQLYSFDFGNANLTSDFIKQAGKGDLRQSASNESKAIIEDFMISDKLVVLKVLYQSRLLTFYINRATNEITGGAVIVDDLDGLESIRHQFLIGNKLVSVIEPMDLLAQKEILKKENQEVYSRLFGSEGAMRNVNEADNVILRIHELD